MDVRVADFAGAERHELFDDTELRSFDEVPAVTACPLRPSPLVVFGGFCADELARHSGTSKMECSSSVG
jgi:hypothetical protein